MQRLPNLQPRDIVEVIAPASRSTDKQLTDLVTLLTSWQLYCIVEEDIFGNDLLCANTDEQRFQSLQRALLRSETKAVICARGGYGSMRLIPSLIPLTPPKTPKLFVGMSDITALNLFLQQHWQWPVLHGALTQEKFSPTSITQLKSLLFAQDEQVVFQGIPLNVAAKQQRLLLSSLVGGNLSLVQSSVGTAWQLKGRQRMIFLEEVGERGYRIDRMLEHLRQAGIFHDALALILGDFTEGNEPNGTSLVMPVLERFAQGCDFPVVHITGVGHGYTNFPLPLGTKAELQLGSANQLVCYR